MWGHIRPRENGEGFLYEKLQRTPERDKGIIKRKNALMLAHNYQRDEVQETADICGDSLGLSQTFFRLWLTKHG